MPDTLPPLPPEGLRFGPDGRFELQPARYRLLVDGQPSPLGGRALDLLFVLASRPSQLFSKDELLRLVWPGLVVEEGNLRVQVTALRKVLGEGVIATVPGRGYRFVAPRVEAGPPALPQAEPPPAAAPGPVLYGREHDQPALAAAIAAHRLVTVLGGGGVGKTSLARAVFEAAAARCVHGGCWVDLAPLADAALVPQAVAAAAGLRLAGGPQASPGRALAQALAPLQMLLVLDNAEHLLPGLAETVAAVLDEAPGVHLLVTSQVPLRLAAEQRFALAPLALPPAQADAAEAARHGAVQLFVARAAALQRGFVLGEHNVQAVVDICRLLDGSPLAIELAAGRLPLLGLPALRQGLGQRLALLSAGHRQAAGRQHSLREAMDWSCGLLEPAERQLLARLSVFAAPVELSLVQAVLAQDEPEAWALVDRLQTLVEASLATVTPGEPPRYGLLETPRAWAAAELQRSGDEAALRDRHARVLAERVTAWESALKTADSQTRPGLLRATDAVRADVDAALAWATGRDPLIALRLLNLLGERDLGHAERSALDALARRLLALPAAQSDEALAVATAARTRVAHALQDSHPVAAEAHARLALAGWGRLQHAAGQAEALACLSEALAISDAPEARRCAQQAAEQLPPDASPWLRARVVNAQAKAAYFCKDSEAARLALHAHLRWCTEAGDSPEVTLTNLAIVERAAGNAALAVELGRRAIALTLGTRNERSLSYSRMNLVGAALDVGDRALARATLEAGWPGARRFGLYLDWLGRLLELALHEGRQRTAFRLAHALQARSEADGVPREPADEVPIRAALEHGHAHWPAATCRALAAEGLGLTDEQLYQQAMAHDDV